MEQNQITEWDVKRLRRELLITRIFCGISSFLTGCLLLGGFLFFKMTEPVFEVLNEAQPMMEQMAQLDVDEVNATLEQINTTLESVDWEQITQALGELDIESINTAIEGLDTEELTEAVENMNNAADVLEGWGNKWSSLFQ